MRRRSLVLVPVVALAVAIATPSPGIASGNTRVSVDNAAGSYTRYDGASDATASACSTGVRAQNEPTVAVDPSNPDVVVAGANDYCAAIANGDVWTGYYRSTDGGDSWRNSLVPGYPADTSTAGLASPVHGSCNAAGDPSQGFDTDGRSPPRRVLPERRGTGPRRGNFARRPSTDRSTAAPPRRRGPPSRRPRPPSCW